jgi:hypothetical protein
MPLGERTRASWIGHSISAIVFRTSRVSAVIAFLNSNRPRREFAVALGRSYFSLGARRGLRIRPRFPEPSSPTF